MDSSRNSQTAGSHQLQSIKKGPRKAAPAVVPPFVNLVHSLGKTYAIVILSTFNLSVDLKNHIVKRKAPARKLYYETLTPGKMGLFLCLKSELPQNV